jgi:hypothetical protein
LKADSSVKIFLSLGLITEARWKIPGIHSERLLKRLIIYDPD